MPPSSDKSAARGASRTLSSKNVDGGSGDTQQPVVVQDEDYYTHPEDVEHSRQMGGLHENVQFEDGSHHHDGYDGDDDDDHLSSRVRYPRTSKINDSSIPVKDVREMRYAGRASILPPSVVDHGGGDGGGDSQYDGDPVATGQHQLYPPPGYPNGNGQMPPPPYPPPGYNGGPPPPHYPPYHSHHYPQPGNPNYYYPHGPYVLPSNTTSTGIDVRGEEVGIVIVVLLLWVGAIILFFNRWGKIRMLEPYQPKFCENHRPSCPMAEVTAISNHPRTFSKFNISTEMLAGSPHFVKCNYHGIPASDPIPGFSGLTIPAGSFTSGGSTGMLSNHRNSVMMNHHHHHHHHHRPRQNSVFVTSPSSQVSFYGSDTTLKSASRKTKSAVDLPTLVLTGEFVDNARRNSKNSITQL